MSATRPNSGRTETKKAKVWLLPEQVEQLRDACLTERFRPYLQDRNLAIISLLYDTGLRVGEVVELDVEDYQRSANALYVPAGKQKGGWAEDATLELGRWGESSERDLRRYLRDRWTDPDAMFPSRQSDRITTRSVRNVVEAAAVEAGVEPQVVGAGTGDPTDVSPHTLRHSVAYRVLQVEGGRLEDVQARLRHKDRETTDRIYSHIQPR